MSLEMRGKIKTIDKITTKEMIGTNKGLLEEIPATISLITQKDITMEEIEGNGVVTETNQIINMLHQSLENFLCQKRTPKILILATTHLRCEYFLLHLGCRHMIALVVAGMLL